MREKGDEGEDWDAWTSVFSARDVAGPTEYRGKMESPSSAVL